MERKKMKKKGFTLVELLVVIAIIAMLLAILMPALGKVRQLAQRMMCASNLSGIGKAFLSYTTDDEYESFPVGGSSGATWSADVRGNGGIEGADTSFDWCIASFTDVTPYTATITSCLYLLIKCADVSPDQFLCPGSEQKKFELSKYTIPAASKVSDFTDVWDFGSKTDDNPAGSRGSGHNSYSYQVPLRTLPTSGTRPGETAYPITTMTNPGKAIAADRNPYWVAPMGGQADGNPACYIWDGPNREVLDASIPYGNTPYHQKDGQNVLFADNHTKFEKSANCGIEMDNIYTVWGQPTIASGGTEDHLRQCGKGVTPGTSATDPKKGYKTFTSTIQSNSDYYPQSEEDNYLVCEVDKAD